MIEAVICDFGGVLTTPLIDAFLHYQERSGIPFQDIVLAMGRMTERTDRNPLHELEKGAITEDEFLGSIEDEMGGAVSLRRLPELYFEHLQENEPMIDFMRSLRAEDVVRTALLTNNVREWEPRWRSMLPDIDRMFDVVVDSAFVGMRKPDPAIYSLTVEQLGGGLRPEGCVFIDDVDVNCDAARELGMAAVQFASTDQAIADVRELLDRG